MQKLIKDLPKDVYRTLKKGYFQGIGFRGTRIEKELTEKLKNRAKAELETVDSSKLLNDLKAKYIGKSGEVTALLRGMKDIPAEKRAEFGKMVNDLKKLGITAKIK